MSSSRPRPADRGSPASGARARSPSPENHLRIGDVRIEVEPGEPFEGIDVARTCACDDVLGKLRAGVALVPAEALAVVAGQLPVGRRVRSAGAGGVGGAETGAGGGGRAVRED